jgi:hypothetical protein
VTTPLSIPDVVGTERAYRVELNLGADAQMLFLARMTAAAVASRADFEYEQVEDLRLAIDELCIRLMANAGVGGRIALVFVWDDQGTLDVSGTLTPDGSPSGNGHHPSPTVSEPSDELSERILDALVDEHGEDSVGDVHRAWLRIRRHVLAG